MRPCDASDKFYFARPLIDPAWVELPNAEWGRMWDDNWHVWCGCPL